MTEGGGKCKANIEKAQKKQKLHYDGKHGAGDLYTDGSEVLKKDFRRKISEERSVKVANWITFS